ncbi:unnamed protein product [Acanthosepion pharaonis]|uniref:Uncharacterized protein n=1 Tax=Acanthosepion pharaonis TaxID=158019 RepID=A0A812DUW8_ACAPH|nr:unnamed protein product [Sepia pharaonis]
MPCEEFLVVRLPSLSSSSYALGQTAFPLCPVLHMPYCLPLSVQFFICPVRGVGLPSPLCPVLHMPYCLPLSVQFFICPVRNSSGQIAFPSLSSSSSDAFPLSSSSYALGQTAFPLSVQFFICPVRNSSGQTAFPSLSSSSIRLPSPCPVLHMPCEEF